MNRALLKADAREAMSQARPHPALVTLLYTVIVFAVSFLFNLPSGGLNTMTAVMAEFSDDPSVLAGMLLTSFSLSIVLAILTTCVTAVLQLGYVGYSMRVFNHEEAGISDLFSYFHFILKAIGLSLFISFFTYLWSLLCFFPGVIAELRYSQAFYILAENPEKGIRECVNESKMLMSGHLWEYFVLQLSFILWLLFAGVTCGIASLYVTPYMAVTNAGYYYSLKPTQPGPSAADDQNAQDVYL